MRVLMISDRYPPEERSAAQLFQDLAKRLATAGHEVTVLTRMPTGYMPGNAREKSFDLPKLSCTAGVQVIRIRGLFVYEKSIFLKAIDQFYLALRILWRSIRLSRPNVVIVYSPPLPLAGIGAIFCKSRHIPYVLNLHDLYPRTAVELRLLKNRLLIWIAGLLENFAYKNCSEIVVPAPGSRQFLIRDKGINASNVHLIFNWVNAKSVAPGPKENGFRKANGLCGLFVISYAGLMGFAQDLATIIECAKKMERRQDIIFILVGDGVFIEKWKRIAYGLKSVRFLSTVSREDYYDVLRGSDVCLVPLTGRLFSPAIPGKMQNIMAVGRPLVAVVPPESDAAHVVRDSGCGFIVSPGDPAKLQRVLEELYGNPSLGEELGGNGRKYAEKYFDIDSAMARFEKILGQAVYR